MIKYKVCVYAICKNEEQFVDKWMDSMSEADIVVVTDTGSTDQTVAKLKARGATVYVEKIDPWRFDVARNVSLDHVPDDVDICVCTDLDERFSKGWRQKLEAAWQKSSDKKKSVAKSGRYLYNWSLKPDGRPAVQFVYSKIHTREGFKWRYPIHEYIEYVGSLPLVNVYIDDIILNHYPDSTKSRSNYLPLLEMAVKETPSDDRMYYYLGREYMYAQKWQSCIDTLKTHLTLPTAKWREERCAAMRWIAVSYHNLGNQKMAISWYFRALAENPNMRDAYIEFAKIMYEEKDWSMVYYLIYEALKIEKPSTTYVNAEHAWDETPYDLGAVACYHLGLYDLSLAYAKKALALNPSDERLINNQQIIKNKAK